ncbi:MAG: CPBP family intramembrane metalloprotease [Chloroflexi bacterium]|nr:CPBP family intramembrane metalloprotease [Chloroflexota bacterium]
MAASIQAVDRKSRFRKSMIIAGILLALAAPQIAGFLDSYFKVWFDYNGKVFAGALSFWAIAAVIFVMVRVTEAQSWREVWSSMGFRRVKLRTSLVVLILSFVTLFVVNLLFYLLSTHVFREDVSFARNRLQALPVGMVILLYLTGVFVEEILYRGYALQRMFQLTGSWTLAGVVSGALFVAFHIPAYPPAHILGVVLPATIVVTLVYIRLQNISYTVMMHGVLNIVLVIAYVVLPLLPG